jgi:hypothetical protein
VSVLEALPDYDAGLYPETRPAVSRHDSWLFLSSAREDQLLAKAVLEADRDLRRREWERAEVALGCIPPGGGLDELYDLPAASALPALTAAHEIGWLRPAPREGA